MGSPNPEQVPVLKKLAYAAPAFSLALVGIPVYVYLPKFYTDVVGIHITAVGYILASVRILDAVTDPPMGYVSDRTVSRFGRRRPYMAVGAWFVAFFIFLLFTPPDGSAFFKTVWFAVCIYALFLSWTVVTVPYESLGPEITFDFNERNSLFGLRDGLLIAGTLAAAASPTLIQAAFGLANDSEGERAKFFWIAVIYAPLVIGSVLWCILSIRERPRNTSSAAGIWSGLLQTFRNRPFVILISAYTISAIGSNLPATLILYYVQYVLQSPHADAFLLLYFATGIVFLPGWVRLARSIGKKPAWLLSIALNSGAFSGVFFLGPGDAWIYGVLVFLSGAGFGATLALPSSIQADVIDYDELLTGERREGRYIGLWSISRKLAAAAGVGIGLFVLGVVGYVPNAEQPDQVVLALRVLYALVPAACNLAALAIAFAYPISGGIHQRMIESIQRRKQGQPFEDPLKPGVVMRPAR